MKDYTQHVDTKTSPREPVEPMVLQDPLLPKIKPATVAKEKKKKQTVSYPPKATPNHQTQPKIANIEEKKEKIPAVAVTMAAGGLTTIALGIVLLVVWGGSPAGRGGDAYMIWILTGTFLTFLLSLWTAAITAYHAKHARLKSVGEAATQGLSSNKR